MPRYLHYPHSSRRAGFSLIELLVVCVIIGILAALMGPNWRKTVGKANTSALRSDLHNLITAEEQYFYETSSYTTDLSALKFNSTKNVATTIVSANETGWAATATHAQASPITCGVFYGAAAPPLAATTTEGVINCQ